MASVCRSRLPRLAGSHWPDAQRAQLLELVHGEYASPRKHVLLVRGHPR